MKKCTIIIFFLLLFTVLKVSGQSETVIQGRNCIFTGFDANAFTSLKIGYEYKPTKFFGNRDLLIYGYFSFPLLLSISDKNLDTWKIEAGASAEIYKIKNVGLRTQIDFFLLRQMQILGTFTPIGADLQLSPVFHFGESYLGIQFKWHQIIGTYITHSEYVKSSFNDIYDKNGDLIDISPEDGWFYSTGSSFNIGIEWFKTLGDKLNIDIDLGLTFFSSPYTELTDAMMIGQIPFYADISMSYEFDEH